MLDRHVAGYYGKSKYLLVAERALDKIVKFINSRNEYQATIEDYASWPEHKIFCENIKKEFGFNTFNLFWRVESIPNAYTTTGGLLINSNPGAKLLDKKPKKRYYDEDHLYNCYVFVIICLIHRCKMNTQETMALILHEIGHNFDNQFTSFFQDLVCDLLMGFIYWEIMKGVVVPLQHATIAILDRYLPKTMAIISFIQYLPYHLIPLQIPNFNYLMQIFMNPINVLFIITGVNKEYFSDSFAARYGYGSDISSALLKIDSRKNSGGAAEMVIYRIPIVRTLMELASVPFYIFVSIIDVHPDSVNRVESAQETLEEALHDPNTPKKLKPEIKKHIELIKKYKEADLKNKESEGLYFSVLRRLIMQNEEFKKFYYHG